MNENGSSSGGWNESDLRAKLNGKILDRFPKKIKKLLTGIFGAENDFDAILGGVNLAGVGANGKRVVHLKDIKRVRLSAPRRLSPELQKALESRMNRTGLKYQPQVFENGWYCACGAFHPKEEDTVYCTECRCDRILLQNALNTLLQPEQPARPAAEVPAQPAAAEEPTRIVGAAPAGEELTRVVSAPRSPAEEVEPFELRREPLEDAEEHTRVLDASTRAAFPGSSADEGTRVIPAPSRRAEPVQEVPDDDLDEDEEDDRDSVAEALIRWVPPITAIVCAAVALCGFVYYQFML